MFVSKPAEVMVLRLSASHPGQISFTARLDRPERFATTNDGDKGLLMTGQLDNGTDGKGTRYVARVRVLNRGGQVSIQGPVLSVSGANEVVLLIAAATDYRGFAGGRQSIRWPPRRPISSRPPNKLQETARGTHRDYQKYFGAFASAGTAGCRGCGKTDARTPEDGSKRSGRSKSGGAAF